MKVIILNDFAYVNGGASQVAIDTAIMLAKRGFDTCLFTAVGPVDERLKCVENLRVVCLGQYDILNDPSRVRAMVQGIWNRTAEERLSQLLMEYDAKTTIIHVHTCQKALSSSCIWRAKHMGFKVVYHMHDYGIACPNLGFYNYRLRRICTEQAMCTGCIFSDCDARHYAHKIWRCIRQFVQNKIVGLPKDLDGYIAVSKFSYNIVKAYLGEKANVRILSTPCQINTCKCITVEKNSVFVFVGRLSSEKNPILLAQCAKKMNVPVLFIGDGAEKEQIKKINPNAILSGWIEREKFYTELQNVRCLVFPSLCYETQGLVVQEMAAYGIPSIVSNTTAASEYIEDGYNGLLFESGNPASLMNCMSRLQDDAYAAYMGKNAFEKVQINKHTEKVYLEDIISFYNEILQR